MTSGSAIAQDTASLRHAIEEALEQPTLCASFQVTAAAIVPARRSGPSATITGSAEASMRPASRPSRAPWRRSVSGLGTRWADARELLGVPHPGQRRHPPGRLAVLDLLHQSGRSDRADHPELRGSRRLHSSPYVEAMLEVQRRTGLIEHIIVLGVVPAGHSCRPSPSSRRPSLRPGSTSAPDGGRSCPRTSPGSCTHRARRASRKRLSGRAAL